MEMSEVFLKVSGYCHAISISLRVNRVPIREAQSQKRNVNDNPVVILNGKKIVSSLPNIHEDIV